MLRQLHLLAATIASAVTALAGADTLKLTFTGVGPSKSIKLNYNASRSYSQNAGGGFSSYTAGRMQWQDEFGRSLTTYCTQLKEYISNNQTVTYTLTAVENVPDAPPQPMGAVKAELVRQLYAHHWAAVKASSSSNLNAAFQLAVWEITHENITSSDYNTALGQLNLYAGALDVQDSNGATAGVASLATSMLADLGAAMDGEFSGLKGLTHNTAQDQLIVLPLPLTVVLAGVGLVGAFAVRRRVR